MFDGVVGHGLASSKLTAAKKVRQHFLGAVAKCVVLDHDGEDRPVFPTAGSGSVDDADRVAENSRVDQTIRLIKAIPAMHSPMCRPAAAR